jgi:hypothetical protein
MAPTDLRIATQVWFLHPQHRDFLLKSLQEIPGTRLFVPTAEPVLRTALSMVRRPFKIIGQDLFAPLGGDYGGTILLLAAFYF